MSDEDDDIEEAMAEAQALAKGNTQEARLAKLYSAANKILRDRMCGKCGYENSARHLVKADDFKGAVEHISYVCTCGHHWTGKTMEQYEAEMNA